MPDFSADRVAEHFVNYLFDDYPGDARHVRRVASWLGLLAMGIEKLKTSWRPSNARQLVFDIGDRRFKARYNHGIKPRGGIEFVEIEKTRGAPEIEVVLQIASLAEAAEFYDNPAL